MFETLTYTEWDALTSKIEHSLTRMRDTPGRTGSPVWAEALSLHGELVTTVKAAVTLDCGCPLLAVEETNAHLAGCVYAPFCRTCGMTHPPASCQGQGHTASFATAREARAYRDAHDQDAKSLTRMPRPQLERATTAEQARHGYERIFGKPSRDELVSEILSLRYPPCRLAEVTHMLYHAPGEAWDGCAWCHPHQGATCHCTRAAR